MLLDLRSLWEGVAVSTDLQSHDYSAPKYGVVDHSDARYWVTDLTEGTYQATSV